MKYAQNFFFSFSWYQMWSICSILFNNWRRLSRLSFIHVPVKLEILCAELLSNFPGGWGIWSPFWPGEGGIWKKFFQKFKCPGGCPGGMLKLRVDWYITSQNFIATATESWIQHNFQESSQPFFLYWVYCTDVIQVALFLSCFKVFLSTWFPTKCPVKCLNFPCETAYNSWQTSPVTWPFSL